MTRSFTTIIIAALALCAGACGGTGGPTASPTCEESVCANLDDVGVLAGNDASA